MNKGSFLIVLAVLALAPARGLAQSEWEQQVLDQIQNAALIYGSGGYALVGDAYTGSLAAQASENFTLSLQGGVSYALVGVCDNDCPDIDLVLSDDSGNTIASDYEDDAYPIVEVTPTWAGDYRVRVYMASCSIEPCFYGVGVYARAAPGAGASSAGSTQNYRGRLESSDDRLNGTYFDRYDFQGNSGDIVVVDLYSSEFDTYLGLLAPSGDYTENDDYEGSTNRSRIEMVLDESGTWTVVVLSYQTGDTGAYELGINLGSSKSATLGKRH